jgi:predicted nucleic acid-binding protein
VIVLDTNVVSELTRQCPEENVLSWLDSISTHDVVTTAVTAAELLYGVTRLPDGHRKVALTQAVHALLNYDLQGRVEPFDAIAAICRKLDASLATRNTKDFEHIGLKLIDPWDARVS